MKKETKIINVVECALESLSHRELVVECLRLEKQVQLLRKQNKNLFREIKKATEWFP
jgi:hypothetical protein